MRLYRIDYPKILWGIVLLSLPFAMPRAAEAEPTRKETARQVGLALSQADAPTDPSGSGEKTAGSLF